MSERVAESLSWTRESPSDYHSELHCLRSLRGRNLDIQVAEDEVALLLHDREVQSCLPVGQHCLEVGDTENLIFVRGSELQAVCVDFDSFRVNVRTRIDHPKRFYDLFLRNSEDLQPKQLNEILYCLVYDCCSRWIADRGNELPSPSLADELEIAAGAALASCGLELLQLDLLGGTLNRPPIELYPA